MGSAATFAHFSTRVFCGFLCQAFSAFKNVRVLVLAVLVLVIEHMLAWLGSARLGLLAWLGFAPIVLAFLGLLACLLGSVGWLAVWLVGLLASLLLLCVVFLYPHDRCQHFAIVSEDSPRMGSPN